MKKIPLVKPEFDYKKLARDLKTIAQSGILTKGKYLATFEEQIRKYLDIKHAYATSSCTAALHLALVAAEIGEGDEVLTSDFSFPATGNAVCYTGAKPVFVDINLDTLCMNLEDLEKKITKKSRAIMVVHAFGYPADMSGIVKIAKKHNLLVIEDAACALGSKHKGKALGTWGDIGCFSFHPRKNVTTGEGGAIVTNNSKIAKTIEILRNHGGIRVGSQFEFIKVGYNYRLSELQAALGVNQMPNIDRLSKARQKIAQKYTKLLFGIEGIRLPSEPKDGLFNYQSYIVLLPKKINRDQVIKKLAQKNIETVLGTYAMHQEKAYRAYGYKKGDLPNSYYVYQHSLALPLFSQLTNREIEYVADNFRKNV